MSTSCLSCLGGEAFVSFHKTYLDSSKPKSAQMQISDTLLNLQMLVKNVKRKDTEKRAKYRVQTGLKFQKSRDKFKVFAVVQFKFFIFRRGSSIPVKGCCKTSNSLKWCGSYNYLNKGKDNLIYCTIIETAFLNLLSAPHRSQSSFIKV